MFTYKTGSNAPIKLKVSLSTVAHAITYASMDDPEDPEKYKLDIPPFSNTDNTSWRQINNGEKVKGRKLKIITFLTFFNEIPDEDTFNLIMNQAKNSYDALLNGGDPSPYKMDFQVFPSFENRTAVFSSKIDLI
jgi:hypothetical protein